MSELGSEARRFTRANRQGVLCTISKKLGGYPFGSVCPFVPDHAGRPVILISTLAEHTKNIDADPRVSLIVQPYVEDQHNAGRVTIVGNAMLLPEKDSLGPRYLRYLPQAEAYFAMHDFSFYRIEPVRIRYIGGFGKIHWLEAANCLATDSPLASQEEAVLAHMNADHAQNLRDYCRHVHKVEADSAEMIGIDCDGFDVRADDRVLRFDFPTPIADAQDARRELVALAQRARA
jgi:heme iron utilization protein